MKDAPLRHGVGENDTGVVKGRENPSACAPNPELHRF